MWIFFVRKLNCGLFFRVNGAASNEERGIMHVGLYLTENTSSQYLLSTHLRAINPLIVVVELITFKEDVISDAVKSSQKPTKKA